MFMSRARKLGKNLLIITIGSFLSKILSFVFLPLYTSVLTTEEYGTADIIATTVHLLIPFATLVIGEALMRFSLGKEEDFKKIFASGVRTCITSILLTTILSVIIISFTSLKQYGLILAINLLASCTFNILSYFSRGIGAVKNYSFAGVINTFCVALFNILFLLVFRVGLIGYMLSTIIAEIIASIYLISCKNIRSNINISKEKYDKKLSKSMLSYSIPLIPNSISWWISNSSDKYILAMYWGLSLNGIYSASYKVSSILSIIINIFSNAWLISAVDDFGSEESKKFYNNIYKQYVSISLIGISGLLFLNKLLAKLLFSEAFYEAWKYQPILIIGVAFHGISGFLGSIYTSAKKTKMILISTVAGAIINIALNFCLIPKYGALGAAIATTISYMVVLLIRVVDSRKILTLVLNYFSVALSAIAIIFQLLLEYNVNNVFTLASLLLFLTVIILNRKMIILIISKFFKIVKKIKSKKN